MEDCYYFLYSNCSKTNCEFRHCTNAKENPILCKTWKLKKTCKVECPFRHSTYHLNKKRHEMLCFYEKTTGCIKDYCEFRHEDVQKDAWKESRVKSLSEIVGGKQRFENGKKQGSTGTQSQISRDYADEEWCLSDTNTHTKDILYDANGAFDNINYGMKEDFGNKERKDYEEVEFTDTNHKNLGINQGFYNEGQTNKMNEHGQYVNQNFDLGYSNYNEQINYIENAQKGFSNDTIENRDTIASENDLQDCEQFKTDENAAMQKFERQSDTYQTEMKPLIHTDEHTKINETNGVQSVLQSENSSILSTHTISGDETMIEMEADAVIARLKVEKRKIIDENPAKKPKWRAKIELLEKSLKANKRKSLCTVKNVIEEEINEE